MALETRRAIAVAINAEIRRSKARLLEDIPKLQRLAFKKVIQPYKVFLSYMAIQPYLVDIHGFDDQFVGQGAFKGRVRGPKRIGYCTQGKD